jgi:hypothetical protein
MVSLEGPQCDRLLRIWAWGGEPDRKQAREKIEMSFLDWISKTCSSGVRVRLWIGVVKFGLKNFVWWGCRKSGGEIGVAVSEAACQSFWNKE